MLCTVPSHMYLPSLRTYCFPSFFPPFPVSSFATPALPPSLSHFPYPILPISSIFSSAKQPPPPVSSVSPHCLLLCSSRRGNSCLAQTRCSLHTPPRVTNITVGDMLCFVSYVLLCCATLAAFCCAALCCLSMCCVKDKRFPSNTNQTRSLLFLFMSYHAVVSCCVAMKLLCTGA